jgi:RNA polymerase sigma-70 factor, ECF subfamily
MTPLTRLPPICTGIDAVMAKSERQLLTEAVFLEFYARTSGPVFGYLRRLTGNAAVAEDLLQDAYVRFLAAARLPEDDDHRRNYLYRIATNLARDHFRRSQHDTGSHLPADVAQPSTPAAAGPDAGDAWRLLAHVSPRDRELLVLAYVEGMTHREIADVTGLMRASVKPLLFRARRRFTAILDAAGLRPGDRRSS